MCELLVLVSKRLDIIKFIKEIDNNIKVTNVVSQALNPLHIRKKHFKILLEH